MASKITPELGAAAVAEAIAALHELSITGEVVIDPPPDRFRIDYDDAKHEYKIDGQDVPGVTGILDATEPKPALTWWGFRVGMSAVVRLLAESKLNPMTLSAFEVAPIVKPALHEGHPDIVVRGKGKSRKLKSKLEVLAQEVKQDPFNIKEERGTVGTSIHVAAEELQITGIIPSLSDFPEEDRGYLQALARYWLDQEPKIEAQELIVGSKRFGYAGRFDKIVQLPSGQRRMRDYKTSGGVYSSFDKQLALYDLAYRELGGSPVDGHDVVHLRPDGTYSVIPMSPSPQDALVAIVKFHTDRALAARLKTLGREA